MTRGLSTTYLHRCYWPSPLFIIAAVAISISVRSVNSISDVGACSVDGVSGALPRAAGHGGCCAQKQQVAFGASTECNGMKGK